MIRLIMGTAPIVIVRTNHTAVERARSLPNCLNMNNGPNLSVVIPILNEEEILWDNLCTLAAVFDDEAGPASWRFVIVDNGSTDTTPEVLQQVAERWPLTTLILERSPNYGRALRAGLSAVDTPWVHQVDIEQWDLEFFRWAWRNRERYDVFMGSKRADPTLNQQSRYRKFLSWGLNALIKGFFNYVGTDTHGPKLLRTAALRPILAECRMSWGQFDSEFMIRGSRAGLSFCEVPVVYIEHRPSRKLMIEKIGRNVWEFNRLRRIMRRQDSGGLIRFESFPRTVVLEENAAAKAAAAAKTAVR
ncbi:MAG: glycosyltransferase family 2 protein [Pseudomonadota bacterium]|nr:hypothetical protein [Rhodospirillaceae bacterium]MEE2996198.1 glycosyltransferase family 2 protein [Pseudomonadota bacterium]